MGKYPVLKFDKLKAYFRYPYVIDLENANGVIKVLVPTIGDIVEFGEQTFYLTLNIFVTNTTTNKLMLWNINKDWNKTSDYELFIMLFPSINNDVCKLLFRDENNNEIDFSKFEIYNRIYNEGEENEEKKIVLYNEEQNIEINEDVYEHIHQYLGFVFNMKPENKFTDDIMLKKWWIDKERREVEKKKEEKEKDEKSLLLSLISSCINHPGFKYNLEQLKDVGVCQFYDSVSRLLIMEQSLACLKGLYSGMVDSKKIKPESYNWMKEIDN